MKMKWSLRHFSKGLFKLVAYKWILIARTLWNNKSYVYTYKNVVTLPSKHCNIERVILKANNLNKPQKESGNFLQHLIGNAKNTPKAWRMQLYKSID